MRKKLLTKAIVLSVLSASLLLPGNSYANTSETNDDVLTTDAVYASIIEEASEADLEVMKSEIKAQLEANRSGSSDNFEELSKYLEQGDIEFIYSIIEFKKENSELSPEEIVEIVFPVQNKAQTFSGIQLQASRESNTGWNALTTAEKWLVALYPAEALIVNAAKNNTDSITFARYGHWTDGDKGNAFRHALWNAIMTLNIGRVLAEQFGTAHEKVDATDSELSTTYWNGYNGIQHRAMDLHNNQKGRDTVNWYDAPYFVTNTDLANRVQTKIDNNEMIILVK